MNSSRINEAIANKSVTAILNSNLISIEKDDITLSIGKDAENIKLKNDLVYIFAGGELPTQFLEKIGITITKKFGEAILKH